MADISNVTLSFTFDSWREATNQVITGHNSITNGTGSINVANILYQGSGDSGQVLTLIDANTGEVALANAASTFTELSGTIANTQFGDSLGIAANTVFSGTNFEIQSANGSFTGTKFTFSDISKFGITGGTSGAIIQTNGSGVMSWVSRATETEAATGTSNTAWMTPAMTAHAISNIAGTSDFNVGTFTGDGETSEFDIGVSPGSVNAVLWEEGGKLQIPGTDFTLNGTVITRTSIPVSGTPIIWTVLGREGETLVPGDGTVTTDKLAGGSVTIDKLNMEAVVGIPVATISEISSDTTPTGWLACDGSAVSRATYSALYSAIGDTYGSGDGIYTFNLPDLPVDVSVTNFESDEYALSTNSEITIPHTLGTIPTSYKVVLRCLVAENGYQVGEEVGIDLLYSGAYFGVLAHADDSNFYLKQRTNPLVFNDAGTALSVTTANWAYVVYATKMDNAGVQKYIKAYDNLDLTTIGAVEALEEVRTQVPLGFIGQFAGSAVPTGFLTCDGRAVSRSTYADLFANIGTTYGSGDGSSTFNVPTKTDILGTGKVIKEETSAAQTANTGAFTFTHSLGTIPDIFKVYMRCTTAEYGFAVGDVVEVSYTFNSAHRGGTPIADASEVSLYLPALPIATYDAGAEIITAANWEFFAYTAITEDVDNDLLYGIKAFHEDTTSGAVDLDELASEVRGYSPVGMVAPFAMATPPDGWLEADGSAISRTTYADLYAILGETFGSGDGSTTFNLPSYTNSSRFTQEFVSATFAVDGTNANQTLVYPHGLSGAPDDVEIELVCTTAGDGITLGQVVVVSETGSSYNAADYGCTIIKDDTNVEVQFAAAGTFLFYNSSGGALNTGISTAQFDGRVRAKRSADSGLTCIKAYDALTEAAGITTENLAADVATLQSRGVIQVVHVQDGDPQTGTTVLPYDDTIPQNTEGDEYLTLSITPTSATSKLHVSGRVYVSNSVVASVSAALFIDDQTDAVTAVGIRSDDSARVFPISFDYEMVAGTTSTLTFKIRIGSSTGTTRFNQVDSGGLFGGLVPSTLTITEYVQ